MFEHWSPEKSLSKDSSASSWNYQDTNAWANLPNSACGAKQQSPIDIRPRLSEKKAFSKLSFENYGNIDKMGLVNSGSSVVYTLPSTFPKNRVPSISGGGLNDVYNFIQFHLHWGANSAKGSEHLMNSKSYPAELHLVHYNTKYGSFAEATKHSDGLAVLGIFISVGPNDNEFFQPLVGQLDEVITAQSETILTNLVPFKNLLPKQTTSFYRYSGSLTTPICNEIVIWTVFDNPIQISEKQLAKFRKLEDNTAKSLVDNFRPAQQLNGRIKFYRSFTGCEIPRSWPITSTPFLDAFTWTTCLINFTFSPWQ
ncbi:carbonic anhydrase 2-like [Daphnia pulicaria]|nr:carbonic anhydrase 2-like isoform X2 [Daphnia pulicaria]XP_046648361.1 carbonic anhydrase 2-like isoform X2 [Daphnia pulicaria]XP_046648363.1 carbonic anhydrase 2-like isoform X2 [Daphnia pulicaria]XP_046648400.1 carbonic anhydrase 2-like [Daphnia pulicaria]XP_046648401.1 carbonic anhydrase 2-like [Daphnia pulicaria]